MPPPKLRQKLLGWEVGDGVMGRLGVTPGVGWVGRGAV